MRESLKFPHQKVETFHDYVVQLTRLLGRGSRGRSAQPDLSPFLVAEELYLRAPLSRGGRLMGERFLSTP